MAYVFKLKTGGCERGGAEVRTWYFYSFFFLKKKKKMSKGVGCLFAFASLYGQHISIQFQKICQ